MVTVCAAEDVPTSTLPKLSEDNEACTSATPVPESVAVRLGSAELEEATVIVPVCVPSAVGVKVTETVQLELAAIEPEHVVAETAKFPVVDTLEMVNAIALVFVQVNTCAAEVAPTIVLP